MSAPLWVRILMFLGVWTVVATLLGVGIGKVMHYADEEMEHWYRGGS